MRFFKWLIVGIGGLIMAAAGISPQDAASNLSAWVEWLGLETPLWLLSDSADKYGLAIGFIMAALGFAAIMGWGVNTTVHLSWPYFRRKSAASQKHGSERTDHLTEQKLQPSPNKHDVDLVDAIRFAAFGKWDYKPDVLENHLLIGPLETARQQVMQTAADGDLPIWGRVGFSGPLAKLPEDYWLRCEIDFFESWKDDKENVATKPRSGHWGDDSSYRSLKTSKGIVEQLWSTKLITDDSAKTSPLISLTDLMRETEKLGWRFTDDGSQHIFDFVRALRDAGSTKAIQFWGREKQRIEPMTKERALSDIDPKYWRKFKINGISCLEVSHSTGEAQGIASDNLKTTTEADGNLTQHGLYADVHLDRTQAVNWLRSQTIVPARIRMTDAAVRAYEATLATSIAERAEKSKRSEKSGSGVEAWYAMALTKDDDMKVYGRKPPSQILVEIPRSDVETFMFENDANELVDQFDDENRYVNLEVLEADFLRSLEKIKREAG